MKALHGHPAINIVISLFLLVSTMLCFLNFYHQAAPVTVLTWMCLWLIAATLSSAFLFYAFVPSYLLTLFSMLIGWRIAALSDFHLLSYILLPAFICLVANFIYCATVNLRNPNEYEEVISLPEWHLIFVRLYIGLTFVPHFTEKLFAGSGPRGLDVIAFTNLQVPDPFLFVVLAGLCEFGAAIAIGLGLFMRLGALGAVVYLLIATYLGHHFTSGFIWAGGGWEYAVLWSTLIFSFVVTGVHSFTLDQRIEKYWKLPHFVKKLL